MAVVGDAGTAGDIDRYGAVDSSSPQEAEDSHGMNAIRVPQ